MGRKDRTDRVRLVKIRREMPSEGVGYGFTRLGSAAVLLWACLVCAIFFYIDLFPTQQLPDREILFLGCGGIALWYTLVYSKTGAMRILLPVTAFLLIFFLWRERLFVWNGIQNLADGVVVQINAYYEHQYSLWNVKDVWATGLFLLIAALLGMWCGFYTLRRPRALPALFPAILASVGGLYVGRFPSWYLWLLFIFCFFSLRGLRGFKHEIDKRRGKGMAGALMMGTVSAACFALIWWGAGQRIEPGLREYQQELRAYQEDLLQRFRSGEVIEDTPIEDFISQFRRESLTLNNDPLSFTGRRVLQVRLDRQPEGTLYLRGFVGGEYGGNRWQGSDTKEYEERWGESSVDIQNLGYETLKGQAEPYEIEVRHIGVWENYAYIPYRVELPLGAKTYGDGAIARLNEDAVRYTGFPFMSLERRHEIGASSKSPLQSAYEDYVWQAYTDLPETGLSRLRQECEDTGLYGTENLDAITAYIKDRLEELTYTRRPAALPAGEDFAEYFLYEEQQGYCVHFATAATLMYRAMGIPARYVSGYALPAEKFGDALTAYALDSMGHAWVEVYEEDLGWIPVEVTPSAAENPLYDEDSTVEESMAEESGAADSAPVLEVSSAREESSKTTGEKGEKEDSGSLGEQAVSPQDWGEILKIGAAVLLAAALILFPILRVRYLRERRKSPPKQADFRGEVCRLGRDFFSVLRYSGYRDPKQSSDREYMDDICKSVPTEGIGDLMALIERAHYAEEIMTEEEYRWALSCYEEALGYLSSRWNLWQKIWIVLIRGWK